MAEVMAVVAMAGAVMMAVVVMEEEAVAVDPAAVSGGRQAMVARSMG